MVNAAIAATDLGADVVGPDALEPGERLELHDLVPAGLKSAGGTEQILRNTIGERVLGLPPEPRLDKGVPFTELRAKEKEARRAAMNFALSDEQELLREAARGALVALQDDRGRARRARGPDGSPRPVADCSRGRLAWAADRRGAWRCRARRVRRDAGRRGVRSRARARAAARAAARNGDPRRGGRRVARAGRRRRAAAGVRARAPCRASSSRVGRSSRAPGHARAEAPRAHCRRRRGRARRHGRVRPGRSAAPTCWWWSARPTDGEAVAAALPVDGDGVDVVSVIPLRRDPLARRT